ncbi:MAG TPA: HIT domain-containing protein [Acidimicrobiales bacterium]
MDVTDDCVFCDQSRITTPNLSRWSSSNGAQHLVFEPLAPVVPGHLLVVPVAHIADATENPRIAAGAMEVAALVARRYPAANIITSIGPAATQTVFHLHLHVVPRSPYDALSLPWDRR